MKLLDIFYDTFLYAFEQNIQGKRVRRFWHYFTIANYRVTTQIDVYPQFIDVSYAFCSPNDNFSKSHGRDIAGKTETFLRIPGDFIISKSPIDEVKRNKHLRLVTNLPHAIRSFLNKVN